MKKAKKDKPPSSRWSHKMNFSTKKTTHAQLLKLKKQTGMTLDFIINQAISEFICRFKNQESEVK